MFADFMHRSIAEMNKYNLMVNEHNGHLTISSKNKQGRAVSVIP